MSQQSKMIELPILLEIEDGWPPVALECFPCTQVGAAFRIEAAPIFVKNLSVGDVIDVARNQDGTVVSWTHVSKSKRTVVWLMGKSHAAEIDGALQQLRVLKCNTVGLPQFGCYSIDVPEDCRISDVDDCLATLERSHIAVAFPSFRHEEDEQPA